MRAFISCVKHKIYFWNDWCNSFYVANYNHFMAHSFTIITLWPINLQSLYDQLIYNQLITLPPLLRFSFNDIRKPIKNRPHILHYCLTDA